MLSTSPHRLQSIAQIIELTTSTHGAEDKSGLQEDLFEKILEELNAGDIFVPEITRKFSASSDIKSLLKAAKLLGSVARLRGSHNKWTLGFALQVLESRRRIAQSLAENALNLLYACLQDSMRSPRFVGVQAMRQIKPDEASALAVALRKFCQLEIIVTHPVSRAQVINQHMDEWLAVFSSFLGYTFNQNAGKGMRSIRDQTLAMFLPALTGERKPTAAIRRLVWFVLLQRTLNVIYDALRIISNALSRIEDTPSLAKYSTLDQACSFVLSTTKLATWLIQVPISDDGQTVDHVQERFRSLQLLSAVQKECYKALKASERVENTGRECCVRVHQVLKEIQAFVEELNSSRQIPLVNEIEPSLHIERAVRSNPLQSGSALLNFEDNPTLLSRMREQFATNEVLHPSLLFMEASANRSDRILALSCETVKRFSQFLSNPATNGPRRPAGQTIHKFIAPRLSYRISSFVRDNTLTATTAVASPCGAYIFVLTPDLGLQRLGTGHVETIAGKVYAENTALTVLAHVDSDDDDKEQLSLYTVSLAMLSSTLLMVRTALFGANILILICAKTLRILGTLELSNEREVEPYRIFLEYLSTDCVPELLMYAWRDAILSNGWRPGSTVVVPVSVGPSAKVEFELVWTHELGHVFNVRIYSSEESVGEPSNVAVYSYPVKFRLRVRRTSQASVNLAVRGLMPLSSVIDATNTLLIVQDFAVRGHSLLPMSRLDVYRVLPQFRDGSAIVRLLKSRHCTFVCERQEIVLMARKFAQQKTVPHSQPEDYSQQIDEIPLASKSVQWDELLECDSDRVAYISLDTVFCNLQAFLNPQTKAQTAYFYHPSTYPESQRDSTQHSPQACASCGEILLDVDQSPRFYECMTCADTFLKERSLWETCSTPAIHLCQECVQGEASVCLIVGTKMLAVRHTSSHDVCKARSSLITTLSDESWAARLTSTILPSLNCAAFQVLISIGALQLPVRVDAMFNIRQMNNSVTPDVTFILPSSLSIITDPRHFTEAEQQLLHPRVIPSRPRSRLLPLRTKCNIQPILGVRTSVWQFSWESEFTHKKWSLTQPIVLDEFGIQLFVLDLQHDSSPQQSDLLIYTIYDSCMLAAARRSSERCLVCTDKVRDIEKTEPPRFGHAFNQQTRKLLWWRQYPTELCQVLAFYLAAMQSMIAPPPYEGLLQQNPSILDILCELRMDLLEASRHGMLALISDLELGFGTMRHPLTDYYYAYCDLLPTSKAGALSFRASLLSDMFGTVTNPAAVITQIAQKSSGLGGDLIPLLYQMDFDRSSIGQTPQPITARPSTTLHQLRNVLERGILGISPSDWHSRSMVTEQTTTFGTEGEVRPDMILPGIPFPCSYSLATKLMACLILAENFSTFYPLIPHRLLRALAIFDQASLFRSVSTTIEGTQPGARPHAFVPPSDIALIWCTLSDAVAEYYRSQVQMESVPQRSPFGVLPSFTIRREGSASSVEKGSSQDGQNTVGVQSTESRQDPSATSLQHSVDSIIRSGLASRTTRVLLLAYLARVSDDDIACLADLTSAPASSTQSGLATPYLPHAATYMLVHTAVLMSTVVSELLPHVRSAFSDASSIAHPCPDMNDAEGQQGSSHPTRGPSDDSSSVHSDDVSELATLPTSSIRILLGDVRNLDQAADYGDRLVSDFSILGVFEPGTQHSLQTARAALILTRQLNLTLATLVEKVLQLSFRTLSNIVMHLAETSSPVYQLLRAFGGVSVDTAYASGGSQSFQERVLSASKAVVSGTVDGQDYMDAKIAMLALQSFSRSGMGTALHAMLVNVIPIIDLTEVPTDLSTSVTIHYVRLLTLLSSLKECALKALSMDGAEDDWTPLSPPSMIEAMPGRTLDAPLRVLRAILPRMSEFPHDYTFLYDVDPNKPFASWSIPARINYWIDRAKKYDSDTYEETLQSYLKDLYSAGRDLRNVLSRCKFQVKPIQTKSAHEDLGQDVTESQLEPSHGSAGSTHEGTTSTGTFLDLYEVGSAKMDDLNQSGLDLYGESLVKPAQGALSLAIARVASLGTGDVTTAAAAAEAIGVHLQENNIIRSIDFAHVPLTTSQAYPSPERTGESSLHIPTLGNEAQAVPIGLETELGQLRLRVVTRRFTSVLCRYGWTSPAVVSAARRMQLISPDTNSTTIEDKWLWRTASWLQLRDKLADLVLMTTFSSVRQDQQAVIRHIRQPGGDDPKVHGYFLKVIETCKLLEFRPFVREVMSHLYDMFATFESCKVSPITSPKKDRLLTRRDLEAMLFMMTRVCSRDHIVPYIGMSVPEWVGAILSLLGVDPAALGSEVSRQNRLVTLDGFVIVMQHWSDVDPTGWRKGLRGLCLLCDVPPVHQWLKWSTQIERNVVWEHGAMCRTAYAILPKCMTLVYWAHSCMFALLSTPVSSAALKDVSTAPLFQVISNDTKGVVADRSLVGSGWSIVVPRGACKGKDKCNEARVSETGSTVYDSLERHFRQTLPSSLISSDPNRSLYTLGPLARVSVPKFVFDRPGQITLTPLSALRLFVASLRWTNLNKKSHAQSKARREQIRFLHRLLLAAPTVSRNAMGSHQDHVYFSTCELGTRQLERNLSVNAVLNLDEVRVFYQIILRCIDELEEIDLSQTLATETGVSAQEAADAYKIYHYILRRHSTTLIAMLRQTFIAVLVTTLKLGSLTQDEGQSKDSDLLAQTYRFANSISAMTALRSSLTGSFRFFSKADPEVRDKQAVTTTCEVIHLHERRVMVSVIPLQLARRIIAIFSIIVRPALQIFRQLFLQVFISRRTCIDQALPSLSNVHLNGSDNIDAAATQFLSHLTELFGEKEIAGLLTTPAMVLSVIQQRCAFLIRDTLADADKVVLKELPSGTQKNNQLIGPATRPGDIVSYPLSAATADLSYLSELRERRLATLTRFNQMTVSSARSSVAEDQDFSDNEDSQTPPQRLVPLEDAVWQVGASVINPEWERARERIERRRLVEKYRKKIKTSRETDREEREGQTAPLGMSTRSTLLHFMTSTQTRTEIEDDGEEDDDDDRAPGPPPENALPTAPGLLQIYSRKSNSSRVPKLQILPPTVEATGESGSSEEPSEDIEAEEKLHRRTRKQLPRLGSRDELLKIAFQHHESEEQDHDLSEVDEQAGDITDDEEDEEELAESSEVDEDEDEDEDDDEDEDEDEDENEDEEDEDEEAEDHDVEGEGVAVEMDRIQRRFGSSEEETTDRSESDVSSRLRPMKKFPRTSRGLTSTTFSSRANVFSSISSVSSATALRAGPFSQPTQVRYGLSKALQSVGTEIKASLRGLEIQSPRSFAAAALSVDQTPSVHGAGGDGLVPYMSLYQGEESHAPEDAVKHGAPPSFQHRQPTQLESHSPENEQPHVTESQPEASGDKPTTYADDAQLDDALISMDTAMFDLSQEDVNPYAQPLDPEGRRLPQSYGKRNDMDYDLYGFGYMFEGADFDQGSHAHIISGKDEDKLSLHQLEPGIEYPGNRTDTEQSLHLDLYGTGTATATDTENEGPATATGTDNEYGIEAGAATGPEELEVTRPTHGRGILQEDIEPKSALVLTRSLSASKMSNTPERTQGLEVRSIHRESHPRLNSAMEERQIGLESGREAHSLMTETLHESHVDNLTVAALGTWGRRHSTQPGGSSLIVQPALSRDDAYPPISRQMRPRRRHIRARLLQSPGLQPQSFALDQSQPRNYPRSSKTKRRTMKMREADPEASLIQTRTTHILESYGIPQSAWSQLRKYPGPATSRSSQRSRLSRITLLGEGNPRLDFIVTLEDCQNDPQIGWIIKLLFSASLEFPTLSSATNSTTSIAQRENQNRLPSYAGFALESSLQKLRSLHVFISTSVKLLQEFSHTMFLATTITQPASTTIVFSESAKDLPLPQQAMMTSNQLIRRYGPKPGTRRANTLAAREQRARDEAMRVGASEFAKVLTEGIPGLTYVSDIYETMLQILHTDSLAPEEEMRLSLDVVEMTGHWLYTIGLPLIPITKSTNPPLGAQMQASLRDFESQSTFYRLLGAETRAKVLLDEFLPLFSQVQLVTNLRMYRDLSEGSSNEPARVGRMLVYFFNHVAYQLRRQCEILSEDTLDPFRPSRASHPLLVNGHDAGGSSASFKAEDIWDELLAARETAREIIMTMREAADSRALREFYTLASQYPDTKFGEALVHSDVDWTLLEQRLGVRPPMHEPLTANIGSQGVESGQRASFSFWTRRRHWRRIRILLSQLGVQWTSIRDVDVALLSGMLSSVLKVLARLVAMSTNHAQRFAICADFGLILPPGPSGLLNSKLILRQSLHDCFMRVRRHVRHLSDLRSNILSEWSRRFTSSDEEELKQLRRKHAKLLKSAHTSIRDTLREAALTEEMIRLLTARTVDAEDQIACQALRDVGWQVFIHIASFVLASSARDVARSQRSGLATTDLGADYFVRWTRLRPNSVLASALKEYLGQMLRLNLTTLLFTAEVSELVARDVVATRIMNQEDLMVNTPEGAWKSCQLDVNRLTEVHNEEDRCINSAHESNHSETVHLSDSADLHPHDRSDQVDVARRTEDFLSEEPEEDDEPAELEPLRPATYLKRPAQRTEGRIAPSASHPFSESLKKIGVIDTLRVAATVATSGVHRSSHTISSSPKAYAAEDCESEPSSEDNVSVPAVAQDSERFIAEPTTLSAQYSANPNRFMSRSTAFHEQREKSGFQLTALLYGDTELAQTRYGRTNATWTVETKSQDPFLTLMFESNVNPILAQSAYSQALKRNASRTNAEILQQTIDILAILRNIYSAQTTDEDSSSSEIHASTHDDSEALMSNQSLVEQFVRKPPDHSRFTLPPSALLQPYSRNAISQGCVELSLLCFLLAALRASVLPGGAQAGIVPLPQSCVASMLKLVHSELLKRSPKTLIPVAAISEISLITNSGFQHKGSFSDLLKSGPTTTLLEAYLSVVVQTPTEVLCIEAEANALKSLAKQALLLLDTKASSREPQVESGAPYVSLAKRAYGQISLASRFVSAHVIKTLNTEAESNMTSQSKVVAEATKHAAMRIEVLANQWHSLGRSLDLRYPTQAQAFNRSPTESEIDEEKLNGNVCLAAGVAAAYMFFKLRPALLEAKCHPRAKDGSLKMLFAYVWSQIAAPLAEECGGIVSELARSYYEGAEMSLQDDSLGRNTLPFAYEYDNEKKLATCPCCGEKGMQSQLARVTFGPLLCLICPNNYDTNPCPIYLLLSQKSHGSAVGFGSSIVGGLGYIFAKWFKQGMVYHRRLGANDPPADTPAVGTTTRDLASRSNWRAPHSIYPLTYEDPVFFSSDGSQIRAEARRACRILGTPCRSSPARQEVSHPELTTTVAESDELPPASECPSFQRTDSYMSSPERDQAQIETLMEQRDTERRSTTQSNLSSGESHESQGTRHTSLGAGLAIRMQHNAGFVRSQSVARSMYLSHIRGSLAGSQPASSTGSQGPFENERPATPTSLPSIHPLPQLTRGVSATVQTPRRTQTSEGDEAQLSPTYYHVQFDLSASLSPSIVSSEESKFHQNRTHFVHSRSREQVNLTQEGSRFRRNIADSVRTVVSITNTSTNASERSANPEKQGTSSESNPSSILAVLQELQSIASQTEGRSSWQAALVEFLPMLSKHDMQWLIEMHEAEPSVQVMTGMIEDEDVVPEYAALAFRREFATQRNVGYVLEQSKQFISEVLLFASSLDSATQTASYAWSDYVGSEIIHDANLPALCAAEGAWIWGRTFSAWLTKSLQSGESDANGQAMCYDSSLTLHRFLDDANELLVSLFEAPTRRTLIQLCSPILHMALGAINLKGLSPEVSTALSLTEHCLQNAIQSLVCSITQMLNSSEESDDVSFWIHYPKIIPLVVALGCTSIALQLELVRKPIGTRMLALTIAASGTHPASPTTCCGPESGRPVGDLWIDRVMARLPDSPQLPEYLLPVGTIFKTKLAGGEWYVGAVIGSEDCSRGTIPVVVRRVNEDFIRELICTSVGEGQESNPFAAPLLIKRPVAAVLAWLAAGTPRPHQSQPGHSFTGGDTVELLLPRSSLRCLRHEWYDIEGPIAKALFADKSFVDDTTKVARQIMSLLEKPRGLPPHHSTGFTKAIKDLCLHFAERYTHMNPTYLSLRNLLVEYGVSCSSSAEPSRLILTQLIQELNTRLALIHHHMELRLAQAHFASAAPRPIRASVCNALPELLSAIEALSNRVLSDCEVPETKYKPTIRMDLSGALQRWPQIVSHWSYIRVEAISGSKSQFTYAWLHRLVNEMVPKSLTPVHNLAFDEVQALVSQVCTFFTRCQHLALDPLAATRTGIFLAMHGPRLVRDEFTKSESAIVRVSKGRPRSADPFDDKGSLLALAARGPHLTSRTVGDEFTASSLGDLNNLSLNALAGLACATKASKKLRTDAYQYDITRENGSPERPLEQQSLRAESCVTPSVAPQVINAAMLAMAYTGELIGKQFILESTQSIESTSGGSIDTHQNRLGSAFLGISSHIPRSNTLPSASLAGRVVTVCKIDIGSNLDGSWPGRPAVLDRPLRWSARGNPVASATPGHLDYPETQNIATDRHDMSGKQLLRGEALESESEAESSELDSETDSDEEDVRLLLNRHLAFYEMPFNRCPRVLVRVPMDSGPYSEVCPMRTEERVVWHSAGADKKDGVHQQTKQTALKTPSANTAVASAHQWSPCEELYLWVELSDLTPVPLPTSSSEAHVHVDMKAGDKSSDYGLRPTATLFNPRFNEHVVPRTHALPLLLALELQTLRYGVKETRHLVSITCDQDRGCNVEEPVNDTSLEEYRVRMAAVTKVLDRSQNNPENTGSPIISLDDMDNCVFKVESRFIEDDRSTTDGPYSAAQQGRPERQILQFPSPLHFRATLTLNLEKEVLAYHAKAIALHSGLLSSTQSLDLDGVVTSHQTLKPVGSFCRTMWFYADPELSIPLTNRVISPLTLPDNTTQLPLHFPLIVPNPVYIAVCSTPIPTACDVQGDKAVDTFMRRMRSVPISQRSRSPPQPEVPPQPNPITSALELAYRAASSYCVGKQFYFVASPMHCSFPVYSLVTRAATPGDHDLELLLALCTAAIALFESNPGILAPALYEVLHAIARVMERLMPSLGRWEDLAHNAANMVTKKLIQLACASVGYLLLAFPFGLLPWFCEVGSHGSVLRTESHRVATGDEEAKRIVFIEDMFSELESLQKYQQPGPLAQPYAIVARFLAEVIVPYLGRLPSSDSTQLIDVLQRKTWITRACDVQIATMLPLSERFMVTPPYVQQRPTDDRSLIGRKKCLRSLIDLSASSVLETRLRFRYASINALGVGQRSNSDNQLVGLRIARTEADLRNRCVGFHAPLDQYYALLIQSGAVYYPTYIKLPLYGLPWTTIFVSIENSGAAGLPGPFRQSLSEIATCIIERARTWQSSLKARVTVKQIREAKPLAVSAKILAEMLTRTALFIPSQNAITDNGLDRNRLILNPMALHLSSLIPSGDPAYDAAILATATRPGSSLGSLFAQGVLLQLRCIGLLMGIAIRSETQLEIDFARCFWRGLVQPDWLDRDDLESLLSELAETDTAGSNSLRFSHPQSHAEFSEDEFNDVFGEDLDWTTVLADGISRVELKPGGSLTSVNYKQRKEYAKLAARAKLAGGSYRIALNAIRQGFFELAPLSYITALSKALEETNETKSNYGDVDRIAKVVEQAVCGHGGVDLVHLRENTICNLPDSNPLVSMFWKVLEDFSPRERSLFLQFVWARGRLPPAHSGLEWKFKLNFAQDPGSSSRLPTSETCFCILNVPAYSTAEELRTKLLLAIENCTSINY